MKKNNIDLNIIHSNINCFHIVVNVERDLNKSGISSFCNLISQNYEKINGSVLINTDHISLIEIIKKLSKKDNSTDEDFEELLETKNLKEYLKINNFDNLIENCDKLLNDLNKMGQIIYFSNESLKNIIITNPEWLNQIFKNVVDLGRKSSQQYLEEISFFLNNLKEYKHKNNSYNCKNLVEKELKELKNNNFFSFLFSNPNQKNVSNVDKISFQNFLKKIEKIEILLLKENNEGTSKFFEEKCGKSASFSQIVYSITHSNFLELLCLILG